MKIGIVLYPTYGGSGIVATELGKSLAEKGHEVHFISYKFPVRLNVSSNRIFYHEVRVSNYPLFHYPPYESSLTSKLVDIIRFEKLDVLHVHYAIPHASAARTAQQILKEEGIQIPFITTLHGTDITLVGKDPFFKPIITFSINKSEAVTTVSESLKQDTLQNFDIKNEIHVIPNFITPSNEAYTINRDHYAEKDELLLVHVSNFRKVKRLEDVIKVFSKIHTKIKAKLILIGDGPERAKAEMLCRELGTCSKTNFVGTINNAREVVSICDLFFLPSETESFGLAALEAMSVGVPVISSNTGGLPEVNIDNYSGYLCDVGDINTMAEKALHLLQNKEVLDQFKQQAKFQANKFNQDKIVDQYIALYKEVIQKQQATIL